MATRNVPTGDSVELYFTMPSVRMGTATTFLVEAKYLGTNVVVPAANLLFAVDEENFSALTGGRFVVRAGTHHFYVCVKLNNLAAVYGGQVEIKVLPQNNKDWFDDIAYVATATLKNRHVDSSLTMVSSQSTEEGKIGIVQAVIDPPLDKPANFNVKITHVTTNSTALDGLQVSTNDGVTWTNVLNNINFLVPKNGTGFLVKYEIKSNQIEDGTRYFDISTQETTPSKVLKPLVNLKTRVTVIDMTRLSYGDSISTYCNGRDLYGIFSDGNGGRYEEPIIINAATCGSVILPPDTVLTSFCAGFTRVQHLSDGAGGYYRKVLGYNSSECGYVSPPVVNPNTAVTATVLNPTRKGNTVLLNPEGDVFGALLRDNGITNYSTRFGKWYFEVKIYLPSAQHLEVGLGFGATSLNMAEWIGANVHSWSWWPYDSTKYHRDQQGIYAQAIDVVNNDVVGILLDMDNNRFGFKINDVWQGWCYEDLVDEKMHFLIAGRFDSWASINFGKSKFKYDVPDGYYSGFGTILNPPVEKGGVVSYFCVGVDRWVKKSNGKGDTYDELFKINEVTCGWIDPKPPAGTNLGFVCDGFDRYNKLADGVGGFTLQLSQINSTACGYVVPTEGGLSNVRINNSPTYINNAVVLLPNRYSFTTLTQTVVVDWGNLSGIWFWELTDWEGDYYVGFQNRDALSINQGVWDAGGIGLELSTGMVNNRGVKEQLLDPVPVGAPVGFKIDFKAQTITVYVGSQSVVISTALNYPLVLANRFFPSATAKVAGNGVGTFNFGQESFHFLAAAGLKAYQKPTNPFPQRGTPLSYKCEVWTQFVSRADGNGESYTEHFANNVAACGWYPDPVIGTILGYYCVGYARWKTVANGNYTTAAVLIEAKSTDCGYIPAGVVVSLFCKGKDQWSLKSDGNDGTYEEVVRVNSSSCGFVDSDSNLSDQEPDPKFNLSHAKPLPVIGYDIVHSRVMVP